MPKRDPKTGRFLAAKGGAKKATKAKAKKRK